LRETPRIPPSPPGYAVGPPRAIAGLGPLGGVGEARGWVLTLLTRPVAYSLFDDAAHWLARKRHASESALPPANEAPSA